MENPHVQTTLIEIVEHQVRNNDPPETRQTLDRLLAAGHPRESAVLLIGAALLEEMTFMLGKRVPFDRARFKQRLDRIR